MSDGCFDLRMSNDSHPARLLVFSKKQVALMRLCVMKCTEQSPRPTYLCFTWASRWMSKEPAEIFERAAEEGFIKQVD